MIKPVLLLSCLLLCCEELCCNKSDATTLRGPASILQIVACCSGSVTGSREGPKKGAEKGKFELLQTSLGYLKPPTEQISQLTRSMLGADNQDVPHPNSVVVRSAAAELHRHTAAPRHLMLLSSTALEHGAQTGLRRRACCERPLAKEGVRGSSSSSSPRSRCCRSPAAVSSAMRCQLVVVPAPLYHSAPRRVRSFLAPSPHMQQSWR